MYCALHIYEFTCFSFRSENFNSIHGIVNSYKCNIVSSLCTNFDNSYTDVGEYNARQPQHSRGSDNRKNNNNSGSSHSNQSSRQNQQPQSQRYCRNGDDNNNSGYYQQTRKKN